MTFIIFLVGQVVSIIKCMLPTSIPPTNIYGHPHFKDVSLPCEMVLNNTNKRPNQQPSNITRYTEHGLS